MAGNFDLFGLLSGASFTAGIAVLVVAAARLILKKAPKRWSYIMWAVVFFRCLCPFAAESSVSVFNVLNFSGTAWTAENGETDGVAENPAVNISEAAPVTDGGYVPSEPSEMFQPYASEEYIVDTESVRSDSDMSAQNDIQNVQNFQTIQDVQDDEAEQSAAENSMDSRTIFTIVWLCGVGAMALYGIVSAARLAARVKTAVRTEKGIYESDRISTAFAAGLLRPKIYIPCGIPEDERRLIVMHERVHIRRRDYLFKLLAFAGLSLHWFNPLIWAAFALMTRDMEMSCDEAVLKECGESGRILYAEALLRVSVKGFGGAAVVGFGETGIKERVKNVLNYKKQGKLAAVAAAVVMLASCTMAGTDAVDGGREDTSAESTSSNVSAADEADTDNSDNENNSADGENVGGSAENTEAFEYNYNGIPEFFGRSIMLSAREPLIVIGSLEADEYNSKNVWLIPIDRTGGISGMGAENFIIDDDGVVTATFRIHCGDRTVASPADGEVLWVDETCVVLDTEYGAVTYGDMKEVELKAGDKIVKGEPLGRTAGDGYTGYAVQASMSISEAYKDVDFPISFLHCRASVSNGAYTYMSSEARFLGDNANTVRLLETADLYEKTPWYEESDGSEFRGTSFSAFSQVSDMADGEQLRQKQGDTEFWLSLYDSRLAKQELRLQEEEESKLQQLREEEERQLREEEERLKKEEAELRRQSEEAANEWHAVYDKHVYPAGSTESAAVLVKPCPQEAQITGVFGTEGTDGIHKGIDFGVTEGTEIYAAADGTVESAGYENTGYGICVRISHDEEIGTVYAHLSQTLVSDGDEVKAGDLIGYSGHTGYAFGNHLHFEVSDDGQYVDPMNYFKI
ncbi:MAG: peptidoglycan DD-metalloendopeptidase family protein [Ruminococcus sp.]|nr:peptidoglycan DD-metalloendopeptidase family protein [Ruminococcus sp.]